jgi:hypothetical protein
VVRTVRVLAVTATLLLAAGCSGESVPGSGQPASTSGGARSGGSTAPTWPVGVVHKEIAARDHTDSKVAYPDSPPMGGKHSPVWADCTGTVYTAPVANENAVHSLEHGAVWVTYRPGLDAGGVATLRALVDGRNYTFMSPYRDLEHAVSVQSWGYQLQTDDPTDPRIRRFITTYRQNSTTTPEPGATCINPDFPGS